MIDQLNEYAKHLNANEEVLAWLNTAGAKALKTERASASDLEHILDYLGSESAPARLRKMSYVDAKRKTDEWSKTNQKKGKELVDGPDDIDTIHDFLDGTRIVKLKTKRAAQREGFLMSHCVGGYDPNGGHVIYSYRDAKNMPHATFEVSRQNDEIMQIKGKGNGEIHPKYIHPVLAFLKSIGMEIRSNDMKNLGYYVVDKSHFEFLRGFKGIDKQLTVINGETYAY